MLRMRLIFQTVLQELKEVCKDYYYWFYQTFDITYTINNFKVNLGNVFNAFFALKYCVIEISWQRCVYKKKSSSYYVCLNSDLQTHFFLDFYDHPDKHEK